ncbi:hypothetical protein BC629DRAFT_1298168 [Irpex lacteus]|nr:hypothetical protein BC629DRAFT_1298168 [Irpex lacteus]
MPCFIVGWTRVIVINGVTIGHSCCVVHKCLKPLNSVKDRFCPDHVNQNAICSIKHCEALVVKGTLACGDEEHQLVERNHNI